MEQQLKIIRTVDGLLELIEYLKDKDLVAYDTETTGVDKESEIIGYSICAEPELGWYVVLAEWSVAEQKLEYLETKDLCKDFLGMLKSKQLVMHNAVFDCFMTFNNFGVQLIDSVKIDTMILAHIVNENRSNGLKELGISIFGEDAGKEQKEMKESVTKNGGVLTKEKYELYKADSELIARYGAKDAILTLKILYSEYPRLIEEGLEDFFFEESMPLFKTVTYDLNTVGLRIDADKLQKLKLQLEAECLDSKAFIYKEIQAYIQEDYPGTKEINTFNIGSSKQLAWLLFEKLGNEFNNLTKGGRDLCKALGLKLPYLPSTKNEFIAVCRQRKDSIYAEAAYNPKTKKLGRPKKIANYWHYLACGKETLEKLAPRYKWVQEYLKYAKNKKLLNTYIEGIQARMKYNVIRPSFMQNVVPSGRYGCRNPNFQNLPRDEKRIKACVISRPGKVFVGADQSQLEARGFASYSGDFRLQEAFRRGEDLYSIVGMATFNKTDATPFKEGSDDAFGVKHKELRQIAKVVALSATYGNTAPKMAMVLKTSVEEAQQVIDNYFEAFPDVRKFMLDSHQEVMTKGRVANLFGRPRRLPQATSIPDLYPGAEHAKIPYEYRNLLNLAVNFKIQSTCASIMNRISIAFYNKCKQLGVEAKIVLQVHDSLIVECDESDATQVSTLLQDAMENTVHLPGVKFEAIPKVGYDLSVV